MLARPERDVVCVLQFKKYQKVIRQPLFISNKGIKLKTEGRGRKKNNSQLSNNYLSHVSFLFFLGSTLERLFY